MTENVSQLDEWEKRAAEDVTAEELFWAAAHITGWLDPEEKRRGNQWIARCIGDDRHKILQLQEMVNMFGTVDYAFFELLMIADNVPGLQCLVSPGLTHSSPQFLYRKFNLLASCAVFCRSSSIALECIQICESLLCPDDGDRLFCMMVRMLYCDNTGYFNPRPTASQTWEDAFFYLLERGKLNPLPPQLPAEVVAKVSISFLCKLQTIAPAMHLACPWFDEPLSNELANWCEESQHTLLRNISWVLQNRHHEDETTTTTTTTRIPFQLGHAFAIGIYMEDQTKSFFLHETNAFRFFQTVYMEYPWSLSPDANTLMCFPLFPRLVMQMVTWFDLSLNATTVEGSNWLEQHLRLVYGFLLQLPAATSASTETLNHWMTTTRRIIRVHGATLPARSRIPKTITQLYHALKYEPTNATCWPLVRKIGGSRKKYSTEQRLREIIMCMSLEEQQRLICISPSF